MKPDSSHNGFFESFRHAADGIRAAAAGRNFRIQLELAREKEEAGACGFFTQPVLSEQGLENLMLARETLQGKLQFYTTRGILESRLLLKDVESRLSRSGFLRTNKSFLVNINMVKEIEPWFNDTYLLIMNHYEKEEVPVSRHYLKDFKTVMGIL